MPTLSYESLLMPQPSQPRSKWQSFMLNVVTTIVSTAMLAIAVLVVMKFHYLSFWMLIIFAVGVALLAEIKLNKGKLFYTMLGWRRLGITLVLLVMVPAFLYILYMIGNEYVW